MADETTVERVLARGRYASKESGLRVIEVGESVGFICLALLKRCPEATVWSVESDSEAANVAEAVARWCGVKYHPSQGVGEELPFVSRACDLIICHTVIEHVVDPHRCLSKVIRVLAPGGTISLEAPIICFRLSRILAFGVYQLTVKHAHASAL